MRSYPEEADFVHQSKLKTSVSAGFSLQVLFFGLENTPEIADSAAIKIAENTKSTPAEVVSSNIIGKAIIFLVTAFMLQLSFLTTLFLVLSI